MPIRALGGAFKFVVRENQTCARGVKGWFEGRVAIGDTPNAGWRLVLGPNVSKALGYNSSPSFDGVGSRGRPLYGNNYIVCD